MRVHGTFNFYDSALAFCEIKTRCGDDDGWTQYINKSVYSDEYIILKYTTIYYIVFRLCVMYSIMTLLLRFSSGNFKQVEYVLTFPIIMTVNFGGRV